MNVPDISEYPVARKNTAINLNAVLAVLEGTPNIINNYKKLFLTPLYTSYINAYIHLTKKFD